MAIENKRMQQRHGTYSKFVADKGKYIPGEFQVVQSNDPNSGTGKGIYIAMDASNCEQMATFENVKKVVGDSAEDIKNDYLASIQKATSYANTATSKANAAASSANTAAQDAANAAEDARGVIDQITKDSYLHTTTQTFVDMVKASPTAYGNAIPEQIEGYIKQDTTKGLQLFDASKMNGYTTSGVHCEVSSDGTIRTKGTLTANYLTSRHPDIIDIKQGEKYSIKIFANKTMANVYVGLTPDDGSFDAQVNFTNTENSGTFTAKSNLVDFVVGANLNGLNMDGLEFKVMITKGEPANWEPYTGGQPSPNPDYPQIVHGVGDMGFFDGELLQGYYQVSDGTFKPATVALCNKNPIPCKPGDKIIFEYEDVINGSGISIFFYKSDGTFISRVNKVGVRKIEGVAPQDTTYCNIVINPVSEPIPVASAKHITVTINDKYAVCVKSKGKNILDFEGFLNSRGSQYTKCGDRYRITGTGSAYSNPILLSDEDEDFTLTGSVTSESGKGYSVQLLNNAGDTVAFIKDDTKKASGKGCKIRLNYVDAGAGVYEDIMVEKGTSHDKYIPYQSTTTYIPVDYPLFEGDKIVRRNGEYKLLRKWGFKTYDGSDDEDWKINYIAGSEAQNAVYNVYIGDMANDAKKERYVPCNYFWSPAMGYYLNTTYVSVTGNYNIIISPDMKIDTDQKWKDWLKTHIMYCAYELATPTEEPLSSEAMKALYSIMACDEETELTIVGVPSDAEIQNQFLLPRNEDGALNTTAYCTAKRNEIALEELVAQSLDARVNKLEVDNESLNLQTLIVE